MAQNWTGSFMMSMPATALSFANSRASRRSILTYLVWTPTPPAAALSLKKLPQAAWTAGLISRALMKQWGSPLSRVAHPGAPSQPKAGS